MAHPSHLTALTGTTARACDLSPVIPNSFTPEFMAALIDAAKARKEWNRANPVSTAGSMPFVTARIENRQREGMRLTAVILNASTLSEPEEHDLLDLEIAASDLECWLDEDMGMLEGQALAVVRGGVA